MNYKCRFGWHVFQDINFHSTKYMWSQHVMHLSNLFLFCNICKISLEGIEVSRVRFDQASYMEQTFQCVSHQLNLTFDSVRPYFPLLDRFPSFTSLVVLQVPIRDPFFHQIRRLLPPGWNENLLNRSRSTHLPNRCVSPLCPLSSSFSVDIIISPLAFVIDSAS